MIIKKHSKILSAATLAFMVSWNCNAQVYSWSGPGGITYYPGHLLIGSPPFQFGLQEYSYLTDAKGVTITRTDWRTPPINDVFHDCSEIHAGPLTFNVPARPWVVLVMGGIVFALDLAAFDLALRFLKQKKRGSLVA